ncbi:hypothetical protein B0J13DRAFT_85767 [Dactylonectria estremocensis]|uniref:Uncharacterized protein n=1 Tax=Dactylonectria estremocensis TaxID=1079267 RepID=A0A9P9ITC5_9HYPO|nr:hypothetical protein B0J13DRAFT_85767 [Dactylonectria estremocensis]
MSPVSARKTVDHVSPARMHVTVMGRGLTESFGRLEFEKEAKEGRGLSKGSREGLCVDWTLHKHQKQLRHSNQQELQTPLYINHHYNPTTYSTTYYPTMSDNITQNPPTTAAPAPPSFGRRMSAHAEADAARAMRHTSRWTPIFERRQSWSKEDQKHAMHLADIDSVKTGPGFSER